MDVLARLHIIAAEPMLDVLAGVHAYANLRACPEPTPGAMAALESLRSSGRHLVLSCNTLTTSAAATRWLLDYHDLTGLFDTLFFSDELGVAKPDPRFFHRVTSASNVQPRQVLHIGDDWRTDVRGAMQAGWQAVWFNPAGRPQPDLDGPASSVSQIRSLAELPALLPAARGAAVDCPRCIEHSAGQATATSGGASP
jgi:putative hydrolase of the HAD superfamily